MAIYCDSNTKINLPVAASAAPAYVAAADFSNLRIGIISSVASMFLAAVIPLRLASTSRTQRRYAKRHSSEQADINALLISLSSPKR